jgi:predicted nucleic acid-binding Zn ribbon protein
VPTYVYKFVDTGETIEVQQSFDDPTLTETTHPATGATMPVKKVFQPVGVTFRGTGFYKTDSRGGKSSTSASSDGAKSDTAKSDSPKSDGAKSDSPKSESSSTSTKPASTSTASSSD